MAITQPWTGVWKTSSELPKQCNLLRHRQLVESRKKKFWISRKDYTNNIVRNNVQ